MSSYTGPANLVIPDGRELMIHANLWTEADFLDLGDETVTLMSWCGQGQAARDAWGIFGTAVLRLPDREDASVVIVGGRSDGGRTILDITGRGRPPFESDYDERSDPHLGKSHH